MHEKKRPPVIFLDMDGVLCTQRAHHAIATQSALWRHLDPIACRLVERLARENGALLVLSSTWRESFEQSGMTCIVMNGGFSAVNWHTCWKTPKLHESPHLWDSGSYVKRGYEIDSWLNANGQPDYVILDDDPDMLTTQKPRFVQTDAMNGFLWEHFEKAEEILKGRLLEYSEEE